MYFLLQVDDSLLYQVDGLCGFYTGTQSDDKSKPDGSMASNSEEYGDSWALEGDDCEETKCSPETAAAAFQLCNTIEWVNLFQYLAKCSK